MNTNRMTQAQYSRHRGVSPARISTLITRGKIPAKCYVEVNGKRFIDPAAADRALTGSLDQSYNPLRNRKKAKLRPTTAEIEAADWNAQQPDLEHQFLEHLRYMIKLVEIDPKAVRIIQPGNDQEGTIVKFNEIDCGDVCPATLCLCWILEDPDDLIEDDQEFGVPPWAFEMHQEVRDRLE